MEKKTNNLRQFFRINKLCATGVILLTVATAALAQGPGSGGPPVFEETPEEETPPPTGVPIDGGATLLLAAGAGYGIKKIRDHRRKKNRPV